MVIDNSGDLPPKILQTQITRTVEEADLSPSVLGERLFFFFFLLSRVLKKKNE